MAADFIFSPECGFLSAGLVLVDVLSDGPGLNFSSTF